MLTFVTRTRNLVAGGRAAVIGLGCAALLLTSACGGSDPKTGGDGSATPSPALPAGVKLTLSGSELSLGETATVAFIPNENRSTALDLSVEGIRQGRIEDLDAFDLDDTAKASAPYYVDVQVKNVGTGNVGGVMVPLWATDAAGTKVQSSGFVTEFETCASEPLPDKFDAGAQYQGCLVFLMPEGAELTGVIFRGLGSEQPITWSGEIDPPPAPKKPGKKAGKKKAGN